MKNAQNGKQFGFMMACFLTSAIFLTACSKPSENFSQTSQSDSTVASNSTTDTATESPTEGSSDSSIASMTTSTQFADLSEFHASGELTLFQMDPWVDGYSSSDGYYRMIPREDGSLNLCYIDFTTKQEIVLCNQPNCTHDSDSCTSWFPTMLGLNIALPVADKVFIVHGGVMYYDTVLGEERLPHIEIMEPDGSERKQIFTFSASNLIAPEVVEAMARDDENLYFCIENHTEEGRTRELCAVSGRTGKVFKLADLPEVEEKIVGTDGTDLILSYIPYKYDLGADFSELPMNIVRFNLQTQEVTPLFECHVTDVGECVDGQYWLMCGDSFLRGYDLKTGALIQEIEIGLPEGLDTKALFSDGLRDGKLMIHGHRATSTDEPSELFYYAIDINTGETLRLEHTWSDSWGTKYPGRIAAQVGDNFMFIYTTESKQVDYLMQDGSTMDNDYTVYQYAFQPVTDYWNNSQEYTPVSELLE